MGTLIVAALAILLGPGVLLIIAALGVGDDRPKWKRPLLRIGIVLLLIGALLVLLLAWVCNDLRQHPIN
jgi:hypothetical protein